MKNFLLYPDCYTEDRINQCRYALLQYLSVYNLRPPADIEVIIYTNKAVAFEVFLSFFKTMQVVEQAKASSEEGKNKLQKLMASMEGNLLLCQPYCYIKKPVEDLFNEISKGTTVLYQMANSGTSSLSSTTANDGDASVQGIRSGNFAAGQNRQFLAAADYFANYKNVKEMPRLLTIFFQRNEEESVPNLVKKVHYLNASSIQKEAAVMENRPLVKKWWDFIIGKNNIIHRYQKKL